MKLHLPLLITLLLLGIFTHAQLYDAQWVQGPKAGVIDFRNDTVRLDTLEKPLPLFLTNACISDENGELLFVCYGSAVTDRNGRKLLYGDTLSPCLYTYNNQDGFAFPQAALFIPNANKSGLYFLLHFSADTVNNARPGTLYYSIIDKEGNFGLGEVVQKNMAYYKGIFWGGGMTACKHANGRDWWIVMHGRNNNRFYKFLLSPNGITDTLIQDIGPVYNGPYDVPYSCFSQDGNRYVTTAIEGYVTVLDFDRCTGEFSNPLLIYNNASSDPVNEPISGSAGLAFSPNGRFVYVSTRLFLTQFDLWSSNIQDSSIVYKADSNDFFQIGFVALAMNGKIYGSTWAGGSYYIHVINKPDEEGDSCHFVYGGQPTLSANSWNLPNLVNYRLGALLGSGCDTITTDIRQETLDNRQPRITPNPADKSIYIEMPQQGNYVFELLNANGQLIASRETKQVDIINTETLENGIYFLRITNQHTHHELSTVKVIVKH